jgi:Fe-S cluster biogenesis protein NfuA
MLLSLRAFVGIGFWPHRGYSVQEMKSSEDSREATRLSIDCPNGAWHCSAHKSNRMGFAMSDTTQSGSQSSQTSIFVRPEATPNPQTLRFVTNVQLTENPNEFKSAQETTTSPLARKLFGFPWTAGIYIGRDFVTVTKQEWVDWETLAEPLAGLIQEHLERGEVVIAAPAAAASTEADSDDVRKIKQVLDTEIRPAVAMDGGDVVFHKFEDGVVHLFMQGSCAGCPSATMTLKMGIETRLREAVPAVKEVVSV